MAMATEIVIAVIAGTALGVFYFGGLYLTVRRLPTARRPALLMAGSGLVRLAVAGGGFFLLVINGHWYGALVALAGFTLARIGLVRMLGPAEENKAIMTAESDAS